MSDPQPNTPDQKQAAQSESSPNQVAGSTAFVCVLLTAVVLAVYWPLRGFDFINYDDPVYFTSNVHVQTGLTWKSVRWAFTNLDAGFWQPLTWLSYMLDVELFGSRPGGPHLTNLFIHVANTLLLFLFLKRLTGALWRSAFVAALFALHPLHVEPVAWISSRKDVLSTFFGLIALSFYVRYAQRRLSAPNFSALLSGQYWVTLLFFVLSLMSKTMLVTLPFVMLLLDYWPLQRMGNTTQGTSFSVLKRLVLEKLPMFALALLLGAITIYAEKGLGGVRSVEDFPILHRLANAVMSCSGYMVQTFWPAGLAVHYPYPKSFSALPLAISGLVILATTFGAIWNLRRRPYLALGWFWYLVTLSPVLGLIQIGDHSHADRYTYMPLIGMFIFLVWGMDDVFSRLKLSSVGVGAVAVLVFGICVWQTKKQLDYWKDSETVFRHALAVTENNAVAHCNLGIYLAAKGQVDEGLDHLEKAVQADPMDAPSLSNLGVAFAAKGRLDEAKGCCRRALKIKPDSPDFLGAYGAVLAIGKEYSEAIAQYEAALKLRPDYVAVRLNLGKVLAAQHKYDEAIAQYTETLRLSPKSAEAHLNLGLALSTVGRAGDAMEHYAEALRYKPDYIEAHNKLGDSLLLGRQVEEAGFQYQQSLHFNPDQPGVRFNFGNVLALQKRYDEAVAQYKEAIRLAPDYAPAHKNLGLALARLGRRDEAISHLTEALRIKPDYEEARQQLRALDTQTPQQNTPSE